MNLSKIQKLMKVYLILFPILILALMVNTSNLSEQDSKEFWSAVVWAPLTYVLAILGYWQLKKAIRERQKDG